MNEERLDDLIDLHLSGAMTIEERRELEERLLHSAADRARFWQLAETHVLLHEGIQQQLVALPGNVTGLPQPDAHFSKTRSRWLQWRPLTAAAAGLVFGMFCTSMVMAYALPRGTKPAVWKFWSDSFETQTLKTAPGLPRETGVWSGDEARVVAAEQGVTPKAGTKMLRFLSASFPGENSPRSAWGDVYRLVDLRGKVEAGKATLRLSACFASAPVPAAEEYFYSVELCALEVDEVDFPPSLTLPWVHENGASFAKYTLPMKGDCTWQDATVEIAVTPQTRLVLAHLAIQRRKPFPPTEPVQFPGHYVDEVKLELLAKPRRTDAR